MNHPLWIIKLPKKIGWSIDNPQLGKSTFQSYSVPLWINNFHKRFYGWSNQFNSFSLEEVIQYIGRNSTVKHGYYEFQGTSRLSSL